MAIKMRAQFEAAAEPVASMDIALEVASTAALEQTRASGGVQLLVVLCMGYLEQ